MNGRRTAEVYYDALIRAGAVQLFLIVYFFFLFSTLLCFIIVLVHLCIIASLKQFEKYLLFRCNAELQD